MHGPLQRSAADVRHGAGSMARVLESETGRYHEQEASLWLVTRVTWAEGETRHSTPRVLDTRHCSRLTVYKPATCVADPSCT
eukprot:363835-Chlamydomonas_euryale.AAC.9